MNLLEWFKERLGGAFLSFSDSPDTRQINNGLLRGELEKLNESTEESLESMRGLLSVAEEQRDIQREGVYVIVSYSRRSSVTNT